jgi:integrase
VRRIAANLFQHDNGVYYARFRRAGRQHLVSLRTRNAKEARAALRAVLRGFPVKQTLSIGGEEPSGAADRQMIAEVVAQVMKGLQPLIGALGVQTVHPEGSALNSPASVTVPAGLKRPDVQTAVRQYLDGRTFATKDTGDMYRTEMNRVLKFAEAWKRHLASPQSAGADHAPPGCDWETFSPVVLWKAVQAKRGPGKGHPTLNQFANFLRHLCRWWNDRGWISGLCLKEAESLSRMEVMPRDILICSSEKMTELLSQIQHEDKVSGWFCRFLAYSGARRQAALDIRWSHVDFDRMTIKLNAQVGKLTEVPMTAKLRDLLIEIRDAGGIQAFDCTIPIKSDLVFPLGHSRLLKAARVLKKWATFLGLEITFFHAFRHYFASQVNAGGASLLSTAMLLGHKNTSTVQKTYVHSPDGHLKQAAEQADL